MELLTLLQEFLIDHCLYNSSGFADLLYLEDSLHLNLSSNRYLSDAIKVIYSSLDISDKERQILNSNSSIGLIPLTFNLLNTNLFFYLLCSLFYLKSLYLMFHCRN